MKPFKKKPKCVRCSCLLDFKTWQSFRRKKNHKVCKNCINETQSTWRKNNPGRTRDGTLWARYKITSVEYEIMLEIQDYKCGICKTKKCKKYGIFSVDHCHFTDNVRGLLCASCNVGIAQLRDSIENFKSAIQYFEDSKPLE